MPVSENKKIQVFKKFLYWFFLKDLLCLLKSPKEFIRYKKYRIKYLFTPPRTEEEKAYAALGENGISPYPYRWRREYDIRTYPVAIETNGLPYVVHQGKRLYFKRNMRDYTQWTYKHLLIEQDKRSAHCYINTYDELKGKILLDIGAAEGIFTLNAIEQISHAYLFECDEEWIEALEATFAPWKEKITIVRKYVSDTDDERQITLDTFMKGKSTEDLFLKMDIEGYEQKTLKGARHLLENATNLSGAIATYHTHDARQEIKATLEEKHFVTETTPGFLYFDQEMRRGIIRFSKPTASKA